MKKLIALALAAMMMALVLTPVSDAQIVPETKKISGKVYHKGRYITVTTWRHGKRITKRVWVSSNRIGHKVGRKTRRVVMGPKHPRP